MTTASSESQAQVAVLGPDETQDSQALYEAYKIELGVGTFSDSSLPDLQTRPVAPSSNTGRVSSSILKHGQCPPAAVVGSASAEQADTRSRSLQTCTAAPNPDNQDLPNSPSPGRSTSSAPPEPQPDEPNHEFSLDREESALRNQPSPKEIQHDVALLADQKDEPTRHTQNRKMDVSQQTPTQVNEDRDYDDDDAADIPWSPGQDDSLLPDNEDRSLQAGETGAVNFGDMSQFGRPSSQVSEDGGIVATRGDWRVPDQTSQLRSSTLFTPFKPPQDPAFETPVVPKNPFGARAAAPVPFAGSQLFGQTQLLSSAIKKASPTSSRPSPNVLPNSFSPNLPETSPLKDRTNVSSPTDIRTSSPQRLNDVPETEPRRNNLERIEEETPSHSRSTEDEIIPESPTHKASRLSASHKPREHYENMKASQQRKSSDGGIWQFVGSDSDSDDDTLRQMERRKKAERKRAQAAEEMEKVSFIPLPRNKSSERHGNKRRRLSPEIQMPRFQASEESVIAQSDNGEPSQQKAPTQSEMPLDGTTQGTNESDNEVEEKEDDKALGTQEPKPTDSAADECVPPTSPTRPAQTQSGSSLPKLNIDLGGSRFASNPATSSFSPKPTRVQKSYGTRGRQGRRATVISSSVSEAISKELETTPKPESPPSSSAPSTAPPSDEEEGKNATVGAPVADEVIEETTPRPVSPSKQVELGSIEVQAKRPDVPKIDAPVGEEPQSSSSSALSSLSSEPPSSLMTTPVIDGIRGKEATLSEDAAQLSFGRNLRARALRGITSSTSPQAVTRNLRNAKRPRYGSESTDELIRSPPESVLEKSVIYPAKLSRTFRQSMSMVGQIDGLFGGMIFALSFSQSKSQERTKLEAKIAQAGGTILNDGFEPLFERSAILNTATPIYDDGAPLKLVESFNEGGFTAVIADGHSRKPKYMQALALGLPCLAHQWITACLNKGEIVSWEDYLLCSGSSAVLDNAIRSRKLDGYPAAEAQLANVVECRNKLLEGQNVLVVMDSKKSRSEAKQPYIFLAQALGPRISRVFTAQQAQQSIRKHAKDGRPFQWIYVDKSAGTAEAVVSALGNSGGKKRKRSSSASCSSTGERPRVLNDELVIQSLILGRIVEEDEMNF